MYMISNRCYPLDAQSGTIKRVYSRVYSVPLGHYHDAKCFPAKNAEQIRQDGQRRNVRTENRASKLGTRSQISTGFLSYHLCQWTEK